MKTDISTDPAGRAAGKEGTVLSLVTPMEESKLKKMAKSLGIELKEAVYSGGKLSEK